MVVCLRRLVWDIETNGRLFVYAGIGYRLFLYARMGYRNKRSFVCVRCYRLDEQMVVCLLTLVLDMETNDRLFVIIWTG